MNQVHAHVLGTRLALLALLGVVGCRSQKSVDVSVEGTAAASESAPVPLDHLKPGELAQSAHQVFGFPIPTGMHIERAYPDAVHLVGDVTVAGVVDYLRKHAEVGAPELVSDQLRFERARIPSQGNQRIYRFDISQRSRQVQLLISDITPPPVQPGLTDEERWRQAGLKPNGAPLNVSDLR